MRQVLVPCRSVCGDDQRLSPEGPPTGWLSPLAVGPARRYQDRERDLSWPDPRPGQGGIMRTQEQLLVDARWTWKPYRVAYEVIKALRGQETGAVVEVITKDDQGLLNDLAIWCRATGHELVGVQPGQGDARVLIRKGEPARPDRTMTVIVSTASLEHAVFPLEKALAGAVLGMDVNVVFEGAGVRLLKRGYRPRRPGA